MSSLKSVIIVLALSWGFAANAQSVPESWSVFNRKVSYNKDVIHLNAEAGDWHALDR